MSQTDDLADGHLATAHATAELVAAESESRRAISKGQPFAASGSPVAVPAA